MTLAIEARKMETNKHQEYYAKRQLKKGTAGCFLL